MVRAKRLIKVQILSRQRKLLLFTLFILSPYGDLQLSSTLKNGQRVYLALDTTVLWNQYCMIHLSVVCGGRAIPLYLIVALALLFATYQGMAVQLIRATVYLSVKTTKKKYFFTKHPRRSTVVIYPDNTDDRYIKAKLPI